MRKCSTDEATNLSMVRRGDVHDLCVFNPRLLATEIKPLHGMVLTLHQLRLIQLQDSMEVRSF